MEPRTPVTKDKGPKSSGISPKPTAQSSPQEQQQQQQQLANTENNGGNTNTNQNHDSTSWRRKQRENRDLREQLKFRDSQLATLADRFKQQTNKIKELEASVMGATRTCNQYEKLLQQELMARNRLEAENETLTQTVARLRGQISVHEKNKTSNDELIRVLNATLMERETEVSILKLKMTRMQTNQSTNMLSNAASSISSIKQADPAKAFAMSGRSNSEFCRNSYVRSSMAAEAASTRSSTTQLQQNVDRDASIWATVPEELTPSKRPLVLERTFQPIYSDSYYNSYSNGGSSNQSSTPIMRDRRYKTLPKSMKSPTHEQRSDSGDLKVADKDKDLDKEAIEKNNQDGLTSICSNQQPAYCLITNLDDSNSTNQSNSGGRPVEGSNNNNSGSAISRSRTSLNEIVARYQNRSSEQTPSVTTKADSSLTKDISSSKNSSNVMDTSHYSTIGNNTSRPDMDRARSSGVVDTETKSHPASSPSTPVKISTGLKKILGKFRRSDSASTDSKSKSDLRDPPLTPVASSFQRGATRSTLVGPPSNIRAQLSPLRKPADFQTDKAFAEWDTDMLVDWLTMIGLSMYATQCRRWVKCGAHIMNATPAEVDKGLGITNHLHRKKLRLAISELNGDSDKITKAASKLDYLWVARWLEDIGLPQHKEAFINARVDGRVLNYLTVEDLVSMGIKSVLHHSSIKCGIKVLRSINFDLQLLKRRATSEEIEQMNTTRQRLLEADNEQNNLSLRKTGNASTTGPSMSGESDVPLWTCHRVMEWLRMIDFAEFASNLRGSGVHGGLIMYEDAFNVDTICSLLSIPSSRTLLRRHLSSLFEALVGTDLAHRKNQYKSEMSSSQQLNPTAEIKTPKKSPLWFSKLKSSKVGQDAMDEYLCPMYPVEPKIIKSPTKKNDITHREGSNLPRIPESINV